MNPNTAPQTTAEFLFRRLADPISLSFQELAGWRLAAFLALAFALLIYLAWMALREAQLRGWPWAVFRVASRLLCFLGLVGWAVLLRGGDSADDVQSFFFRTAEFLAISFGIGVVLGIVFALIGGPEYLEKRSPRLALTLMVVFGLASLLGGVVGYFLVANFRQEASRSGFATAVSLAGLRVLTFVGLTALFLTRPEALENTPPLLLPGYAWLFVFVPVLALALVFVVWMYVRDSRTAGPILATLLGVLRGLVYAVLALVFLLPALQMWDTTETPFKNLVAFDVSRSMNRVDDLPRAGEDPATLLSRQDKVIRAFTGENNILKQLQEKNTVAVYRVGGHADVTPLVLKEGGPELGREELTRLLKPDLNQIVVPDDVPEAERAAYKTKAVNHLRQMINSTNLYGSLLQLRKRESGSQVNAVILISDGRINQGSLEALNEFLAWANDPKRQIPIITIGVGMDIQPKSIRLADLRAPEYARPDDKFPIFVPVFGTNLPKYPFEVTLEAVRVKDKDGNPLPNEKPVPLPKKEPGQFPEQGGETSTQVEFKIDLKELKGLKDDAENTDELEGTWEFRARLPRHPEEAFAKPEHVSERPARVVVVKRPLRVLLFAGGPSRDYQFLRRVFFQEVRDKRMEMSVYLQTQAGNLANVEQDVEAKRLLERFPSRLGPNPPEYPYESLDDYDVIIAFDPDWKALSPEQLTLVNKWVTDRAGGIIFVAGPVNSNDLAHKDNVELAPINALYPVRLLDSRLHDLGIDKVKHRSDRNYALHFSKLALDFDFLRLDDKEGDSSPTAGWNEFFWGGPPPEASKDVEPRRGMHNYHPVKEVRKDAAATVVATFAGPPASRINEGKDEMPYMVSMKAGNGKTFYIGSPESFRVRMFKAKYHERFWIKLARFVGSGNFSKLARHGAFQMAQNERVGNVRVEVELLGPDLSPLPRDARPEVKVKRPPYFNPETDRETPEKITLKPSQVPGEWKGKFEASVPFQTAGEYELELQVPGTTETLHHTLNVRESDLEIENVRPDHRELYRIASDAGVLLKRLDRKQQDRLLKLISTPAADKGETKPGEAAAKDKTKDKVEAEGQRLFFELKNAEEIPTFLEHLDPQQDSVKGRLQDLWDRGLVSGQEASVFHLAWIALALVGLLVAGVLAVLKQYRPTVLVLAGTAAAVLALLGGNYALGLDWAEVWGSLPLDMATVLGVVVGLLSLEWLIRKLIRLA